MQGSPRNTGRWTMTGRLLLGMLALTVTGACGSDQAVAPEATSAPAGPAALAPAAGGAELLVLVDEKGTARRVLIVRGERDPRRREVERLGFRTLSHDAVTNGGVDAVSRGLFAAGETKGIPVRYFQAASVWDQAFDAQVAEQVATRSAAITASAKLPSAEYPRSIDPIGDEVDAAAVMASIESTMIMVEGILNLAVTSACTSDVAGHQLARDGADRMATDEGAGDCDRQRFDAIEQSLQAAAAGAAVIGSLASCGATMGASCLAIPVLHRWYILEADEAVKAGAALSKCLSGR